MTGLIYFICGFVIGYLISLHYTWKKRKMEERNRKQMEFLTDQVALFLLIRKDLQNRKN